MLRLSLLLVLTATMAGMAQAQQTGPSHITNTENSRVAITGAVIGCILVVLALVAVAVYGIERWCARRRKARGGTTHNAVGYSQVIEREPGYRYLALLPPPASAKRGPFYPGSVSSPPASPSPSTPTSFRGNRYAHGPFYPGSATSGSMSLASPPASPNSRRGVSSPSTPSRSPGTPSFRVDGLPPSPYSVSRYMKPRPQSLSTADSPSSSTFEYDKDSGTTLYSASASSSKIGLLHPSSLTTDAQGSSRSSTPRPLNHTP
ncbi:hypothetical protein C8J57DRAFT_1277243 [Mycena rebaudengoi]|nr:hypothetical protein C8J57DRAFT_1277243 [Mycena rebaudengoi]